MASSHNGTSLRAERSEIAFSLSQVCYYHRKDRAHHKSRWLAKYMGDGVLAYFGYPQAHEDDAERAVH